MKTKEQFHQELAHLCEVAIAQSIWRPASVTQEPETRLTQWRVMKVFADFNCNKETIHFIGSPEKWHGEGRVCSAVQEYDAKTKRGVTQSGRVYELVGDSGYNGDAMYVWSQWFANLGPTADFEDVTSEYE